MAYTSHPGTWDNCVIYLPSFSLYPDAFKQTASGSAAGIGDPVGEVDSGVSTWKWDSPNTPTERRPVIASDGGLQFGTISATARYLRLTGSEAYTKVLHEGGELYFMVRFRFDDDMGSGTRVLFDTTNLGNAAGVRAFIASTNAAQSGMTNGTSAIGGILTTDTVPDDNLDHVLKGRISAGTDASNGQLDWGTKIFGTRTGTLGTGNTGVMYVGNRASLTTPIPARIYELWIGTAPPTLAQEAEWDANNPAGSITGRTVLETPTIRCELEPLYGYAATRHRWNNLFINSVAGSEGPVYRIGATWYGSVHAVDLGGEAEVLSGTEVWVDGVSQGAVVASGQYHAANQFKFRRQVSESGPAFSLDSTITASGDKFVEDVTITRRDDEDTVVISYPIRCGRALGFAPYRFLDAAGEITGSGTLTTDGANDPVSDPGTPACAQFNSTLGVMVLAVLTKGAEYLPTCELFGTAENSRVYWRSTAVANSELDDQFRFRVETYYYTATSETWEALAQSELLKILAQPSGHRGMGFGVGLSM